MRLNMCHCVFRCGAIFQCMLHALESFELQQLASSTPGRNMVTAVALLVAQAAQNLDQQSVDNQLEGAECPVGVA